MTEIPEHPSAGFMDFSSSFDEWIIFGGAETGEGERDENGVEIGVGRGVFDDPQVAAALEDVGACALTAALASLNRFSKKVGHSCRRIITMRIFMVLTGTKQNLLTRNSCLS